LCEFWGVEEEDVGFEEHAKSSAEFVHLLSDQGLGIQRTEKPLPELRRQELEHFFH
jgi:hypothetical protein